MRFIPSVGLLEATEDSGLAVDSGSHVVFRGPRVWAKVYKLEAHDISSCTFHIQLSHPISSIGIPELEQ